MKQQTKKQNIEEALEELHAIEHEETKSAMTNQIENTQGKTENTMTNQDQNTQKLQTIMTGYDQHASHLARAL